MMDWRGFARRMKKRLPIPGRDLPRAQRRLIQISCVLALPVAAGVALVPGTLAQEETALERATDVVARTLPTASRVDCAPDRYEAFRCSVAVLGTTIECRVIDLAAECYGSRPTEPPVLSGRPSRG